MKYAKRTDLSRANQGNNFIHTIWGYLYLWTLVQKDKKETKKFCTRFSRGGRKDERFARGWREDYTVDQ